MLTLTANGVLLGQIIAFLGIPAALAGAAAEHLGKTVRARVLLAGLLGAVCGVVLAGLGMLEIPTEHHRVWDYVTGFVFGGLVALGGRQLASKLPKKGKE